MCRIPPPQWRHEPTSAGRHDIARTALPPLALRSMATPMRTIEHGIGVGSIFRHDIVKRFSTNRIVRYSVQFLVTAVDEPETPLQVLEEQHRRHVVDDGLEQGLAFPQRRFGPLDFGDVKLEPAEGGHVSGKIEDGIGDIGKTVLLATSLDSDHTFCHPALFDDLTIERGIGVGSIFRQYIVKRFSTNGVVRYAIQLFVPTVDEPETTVQVLEEQLGCILAKQKLFDPTF